MTPERQIADFVRRLRHRADSYWRDSAVFQEDGDLHAAVAYRMIAEELRRCATEFEEMAPTKAEAISRKVRKPHLQPPRQGHSGTQVMPEVKLPLGYEPPSAAVIWPQPQTARNDGEDRG